MKNSIQEEKEATLSGYFPLFHYNPLVGEFKLDSQADFSKYEEFINGEDRYLSLSKITKNSKELLNRNKKNAEERYKYYQSLTNEEKE